MKAEKYNYITAARHFLVKIIFPICVIPLFAVSCHYDQTGKTGRPQLESPPQTTTAGKSDHGKASWADYDKAVKHYVSENYEEAYHLLTLIEESPLTSNQKKRLTFLKGVSAYKSGRFDQVDRYHGNLDGIDVSLHPYTYYFRGMAQWGIGNYDEARELLTVYLKKNPSGYNRLETKIKIAETLYHQGDKQAGVNACTALLTSDSGGKVLFALAQMKEGLDRKTEAMEYYRKAMEASNTRDVRAVSAHKYYELLKPVINDPGMEDKKLELVKFLRREWRLNEAIDVIKGVTQNGCSDALNGRLASEKASLQFYSGDVENAKKYYANSSGSSSGSWMYARSLYRLGEWDDAAPAFLKAAQVNGGKRADEARYHAWLIQLRENKPEEAEKTWGLISESARNGVYKDDYYWQNGFYHYRNKQFKNAADQFKGLIEENPKSKYKTAAEYWQARSLEEAGRFKDASVLYKKLASQRKDLYYRMRAEHRLGWVKRHDHWDDLPVFQRLLENDSHVASTSFLPISSSISATRGGKLWALGDPGLNLEDLWTERKKLMLLSEGKGPNAAGLKRIKELAESGVLDIAYYEAAVIRKHIPPGDGNGDSGLRIFAFMSAYLAETENYSKWVRLQYDHYRLLTSGKPEEDKTKAQRRFYPLAYPEEVLSASNEFFLHPALIMAVIRTESYYNPHILSWANARGLMQILPSTGSKIAKRINHPEPHPESLFDPKINIWYGSWYLAELTKEFGGQYPLAIASYNAGPFNVRRWVEKAGDVSMEEFIEMIPFDQTRIYVKKILGHMYQYRMIYAGRACSPDLAVSLRTAARNTINF